MAHRDPHTDHLLTPQNSAIVLIDYQPGLIEGTHSISHDNLLNNAIATAKTAAMYAMPTIVSTIAVEAGYQQDTVAELKAALGDHVNLDRSVVNAWEDPRFRAAVEATGRRKFIMAALWTEVCLMYPALDMLRAGWGGR